MSRHLYIPFLVLWIIVSANQSVRSDELDLEKIRKTLKELANRELAKGVSSISIALVKDGKIVLKDAWGYSNFWTKTKARPETIYCVGSTFKSVTATAILQLAEKGKLALDDPANKHLGKHKFLADEDNKVTIRHLLNHTSGLSPGASTRDIWSRQLPIELQEIPAKMKVVSEPGTQWVYNNYAYAVAGLIVEKVSGEDYEKFVLQNILKPLGIKTAGPVRPTPDMLQRMALPYLPGPDGKPRPTGYVHYDVYPAGDVYLTAEDMARFLAMHLGNGKFGGKQLLSTKSIEEAHTPHLQNYAQKNVRKLSFPMNCCKSMWVNTRSGRPKLSLNWTGHSSQRNSLDNPLRLSTPRPKTDCFTKSSMLSTRSNETKKARLSRSSFTKMDATRKQRKSNKRSA